MGRRKNPTAIPEEPMCPPALTPEARENQLIALAYDLAEKRIREGTASPSEITHFLKLGSPKEKLEREILVSQNKLYNAKTQSIEASQEIKELYEQAMEAVRSYRPQEYDE